MIRLILLLFTAFLYTSCGSDKKESRMANHIKVEYHGALKNMMHKGDVAAKTDLSKLKKTEHLYALGALENLKGEIQIFDGVPYNTMVIDDTLAFDASFDKKATLLVYASIDKWKSFNIPSKIVTHKQLESYIANTAKANEINIHEPFPFLIDGTLQSFDWHVINWTDGDTDHSHQKHINSGLNGTINNRPVELIGFYSDAHHAIFTYHTTDMHIHVKTVDNALAGHVDDLTLGRDMVLRLPDVK